MERRAVFLRQQILVTFWSHCLPSCPLNQHTLQPKDAYMYHPGARYS